MSPQAQELPSLPTIPEAQAREEALLCQLRLTQALLRESQAARFRAETRASQAENEVQYSNCLTIKTLNIYINTITFNFTSSFQFAKLRYRATFSVRLMPTENGITSR